MLRRGRNAGGAVGGFVHADGDLPEGIADSTANLGLVVDYENEIGIGHGSKPERRNVPPAKTIAGVRAVTGRIALCGPPPPAKRLIESTIPRPGSDRRHAFCLLTGMRIKSLLVGAVVVALLGCNLAEPPTIAGLFGPASINGLNAPPLVVSPTNIQMNLGQEAQVSTNAPDSLVSQ